MYCWMNWESVRIFQRVSIGASTSIDLRISNSVMSVSPRGNISRELVAMIGKTRQGPAVEIEEIFDPGAGKSRGVLRLPPAAGEFRRPRRSPPAALAPCIAPYLVVVAGLPGRNTHVH